MIIVLAITWQASDITGLIVRILLEENKFDRKIHVKSYATYNFIFFLSPPPPPPPPHHPVFYLTTNINASFAPFSCWQETADCKPLLCLTVSWRHAVVLLKCITVMVSFYWAIFKGGDSVRLTDTRHT